MPCYNIWQEVMHLISATLLDYLMRSGEVPCLGQVLLQNLYHILISLLITSYSQFEPKMSRKRALSFKLEVPGDGDVKAVLIERIKLIREEIFANSGKTVNHADILT